jgi:hypothetical protein
MTPFPAPEYFGTRRRCWLSSLLAWEAAMTGKPPPPPLDPSDERYFTANQVRDRLNVSDMWLWRRRPRHSERDQATA